MYSLQLDDEQLEIQRIAKQFANDVLAKGVIQRDINATFPYDELKQMGELGFMGATANSKWNGSELSTLTYVIALEEIARVDAASAVVMSVQNSLVNWILESFGSEEQKEKYLTKLTTGEYIGSYCLSEPEAGSDARQQHTLAQKIDGKWHINGTKNWITSAQNADVFIVFAQTNSELKHKGIACFVIPKGTDGLTIGLKEDKMGLRASDTCSVGLSNVVVGDDALIGSVGDGFYIAMKGLTGGRIGIAAQSLGIAQGAFDLAVNYSLQRKTMGNPICDHQAIQMKLAQMSMKISAARALVHKAAWLKDNGIDCNRESSEAKLFASTIANEITREAVQIHGGYGYVREYQVERMMRDAKVTEIYEGTSEIQHIVIARDIIKSREHNN